MKAYPIEIGSVVRSKAGRDEGRLFVVTEIIDDDFVYVVNGALRGIERPKKKRKKHLKPNGSIISQIAAGEKFEDHEIRAWLKKEEQ